MLIQWDVLYLLKFRANESYCQGHLRVSFIQQKSAKILWFMHNKQNCMYIYVLFLYHEWNDYFNVKWSI